MKDIKKRVLELNSKTRAELAEKVREKIENRARLRGGKTDYDVVILGGGLAGSTLARQLIRQHGNISILVLEKKRYPCPEIAFKVGESASEAQAYYYGRILGLEEHFTQSQIEKGGARYFFSYKGNRDISQRLEVGLKNYPPVPGYQFDRGRFENHLYQENTGQGVTYWDGCRVTDLSVGFPHKIALTRDEAKIEISARWIVDASGRAAVLKRKLRLQEKTSHASNAVWMRLSCPIDIDSWSDNPAWRQRTPEGLRKVGTTHLLGEGYWVWIILLPSNATSVGIVADPAIHPLEEFNHAEGFIHWLEKNEPQCAETIKQNREKIEDFLSIQHFSHGCKRVFSKDRWGITGDAGVFTDPFYSPGGDFIGMANSLICDLIARDLEGKNIESLVEQYNCNFLNMFKLYMATYEDQYPVMGNPRVMLAKIIWDWAIYWGVNAFLFFNSNKSFDWHWLSSVQQEMIRFNRINNSMQSLFKYWNKIDKPDIHGCMFSLLDLEFLYKLHTGLVAELSEEQARRQLAENIQVLEIISKEYLQYVEKLQYSAGAALPPFMQSSPKQKETAGEGQDYDFPPPVIPDHMRHDLNRIWIVQP